MRRDREGAVVLRSAKGQLEYMINGIASWEKHQIHEGLKADGTI
jgi:hypothetical protein